mmetsp:Transcript_14019/g.39944  ORF Transcript_14019/g.39944 Transcript_14019/m.39944 type:complete len:229 (+) Transcript_14019:1805-2491(+)
MQDDVLRGHALAQFSINVDEHVFGLALWEGLGREDVLYFARSNAECQRAERTMRCRVGVATHSDAPRKGESLFWADDVNDSLPLIRHAEVLDAKVLHILFQLEDLGAAGGFLDELGDIDEAGSVLCGDVVVHRRQGAVGASDAAVGKAESLEGLRRGDLVHQMPIHVYQRRHAIVGHDMVVPDLVVQGPAGSQIGARRCKRRRFRRLGRRRRSERSRRPGDEGLDDDV